MFNWEDDKGLFILLGILTALILVGGYLTIKTENQQESQFMQECAQDHKHYECVAMWRQGENHSTVIPVPVTISR